MNQKFKNLVKMFQRLPGVGPRQGARFVLALLDKPEEELQALGTAIFNLKREIGFCGECFNISEEKLCHICSDSRRDKTKLLVVEKPTDLDSVEKTGLYKGLYHVLGGAINPLEKVVPANLRIKELERRVGQLSEERELELIIATNPNTAGETTALFIRDIFSNWPNIALTRLGRGLASGSNLEYIDEATLKNALDYRK